MRPIRNANDKDGRKINPKLGRLIANMYYVGAVAHLLGVDEDAIEKAVKAQFKGKEKAVELNIQAISEGREYANENWDFDCQFSVESRDKDPNTFLIEGNEAIALGSIYGGISMLSWYPITPSSSLAESVINWLQSFEVTVTEEYLCRDSSRGRASSCWDGSRCWMGRRKGDDLH